MLKAIPGFWKKVTKVWKKSAIISGTVRSEPGVSLAGTGSTRLW